MCALFVSFFNYSLLLNETVAGKSSLSHEMFVVCQTRYVVKKILHYQRLTKSKVQTCIFITRVKNSVRQQRDE